MQQFPRISVARPSPQALRFLRSAVAAQTAQSFPARAFCRHARPISRTICAASPRIGQPISLQSRRSFTVSSRRSSDLPSNPQTHYDFFPATLPDGPPPAGRFGIDLKELRNEFLQLQAQAHPDRHPQERKSSAEALSARINEAYKTLQSPLLRAQYLLSLRGNDSPTDDAAKLGEDDDEQVLLMEVLELREQIEAAESEDEIQELKQENDLRIAESVKVLEDAFESDHLDEAAKEAVKLRYWTNVDDTLHAWEEGKPAPNLSH